MQHGKLVSARMKRVDFSIHKPYICEEGLNKQASKIVTQEMLAGLSLVL